MNQRLLAILKILSQPAVAIGGAVVIAVVSLGAAWYLTREAPTGAYVAAAMAPITQEVDVTGAVKAAQSTDLSFQVSGQVASINVAVGQHVGAGQVLAALGSASQAAALEEAQAGLATAEANLAQVQAGTRPEQLAVDQTSVTQAQATLWNALESAYVTADDAIHNKADTLFNNPRTSSASINFTLPDFTLENRLDQERVTLEPILDALEASAANASFGTGDPTALASTTKTDLVQINSFLDDLSQGLQETAPSSSLSATALAADEATINTARVNVSTALTTITADQTALAAAQGALTLAQAGSTPQAIAASQAQVDEAQAAVDASKVAEGNTVLVAPIGGVITVQNANLGETVAPGTPLISLESDSGFEADVQVSDADIGKLKIGQAVQDSFNAYPGVTFPATVTQIDPAASIDPTTGVASYTATVTFNENDPRITAGLTANLHIITDTIASALVVPTSAIITDNNQAFVYVHTASGDVKTPVEVGVSSAAGMTQITSGLSGGQEVLTFGTTSSL